MDEQRRKVMQAVGGGAVLAAAGLPAPEAVAATQATWDSAAFETHTFADAARSFGNGTPMETGDITLTAPELAENGAVVPFTVASRVPGTAKVALLVEKNPWILAVSFGIPPGTEPTVTTRIKMAETSRVIALVATNEGKLYYAARNVKVTLGGCGG